MEPLIAPPDIRGKLTRGSSEQRLRQRLSWILEERAKGRAVAEIADSLNISASAVHQILKRELEKRLWGTSLRRSHFTPSQQKALIKAARAKGHRSVWDLARASLLALAENQGDGK